MIIILAVTLAVAVVFGLATTAERLRKRYTVEEVPDPLIGIPHEAFFICLELALNECNTVEELDNFNPDDIAKIYEYVYPTIVKRQKALDAWEASFLKSGNTYALQQVRKATPYKSLKGQLQFARYGYPSENYDATL